VLVVGALAVGPMAVASSIASANQCTNTRPSESVSSSCAITGQATVAAGSLAVGAPSTVKWTLTLTAFDFKTDDRGPFTVTAVDATGSGTGWNLTATVTPFTDSTGTTRCTAAAPCRMHKPLTINGSATSAKVNKTAGEECDDGATCTLSTNTVTYPVTLPTTCAASGRPCEPAVVASAAKTSGMGAIDLTTDWWLTIPANTYAGTYTSTITLSMVSGP
jgi:hypothetical protein